MRSTPWVPRAAQAGRPHPARVSQSKSPSATTAHGGAGPRPCQVQAPAWDPAGPGTGALCRDRRRVPQASGPGRRRLPAPYSSGSGTTTMPANRSAPRSMNSPESLSLSAVKPCRLRGPAAGRSRARSQGPAVPPHRVLFPLRRGTPALLRDAGSHRRRSAPRRSAGWGRVVATRRTSDAAFRLDDWRTWAQARGCRPAARWPPAGSGPIDPLDEVQHVSAQPAAEAVPPFRVGVHREAALRLVVKGAESLADPAPSPQPARPDASTVSPKGMPRLQRGDVDVGRTTITRLRVRGRSPRRLRRETTFPGSQRIPMTAATSSAPSSP